VDRGGGEVGQRRRNESQHDGGRESVSRSVEGSLERTEGAVPLSSVSVSSVPDERRTVAHCRRRQTPTALNVVTASEMRDNVIRLAFGGSQAGFDEFCSIIRQSVPEAHAAVLRGSAVTGVRYGDEAPFDADGPGTSDLDLTLVGSEVLSYFEATGYW